jgi:hypothetical protein
MIWWLKLQGGSKPIAWIAIARACIAGNMFVLGQTCEIVGGSEMEVR